MSNFICPTRIQLTESQLAELRALSDIIANTDVNEPGLMLAQVYIHPNDMPRGEVVCFFLTHEIAMRVVSIISPKMFTQEHKAGRIREIGL